jgi:Domain of unknown function (DUF4962)/Heparinase II/III-like protein
MNRCRTGTRLALPLAASVLWLAPSAVLTQQPPETQEPSLVDNGEFEERAADGWLQGWEKVGVTADATVEVTGAEGGNTAIRMTGKTGGSRAGLQAPIRPFDDETLLRVAVRYRGEQGRRTIVVRYESGKPKSKPIDQKVPLPPTRDWRPFETTVTIPPEAMASEEGEAPAGKWLLILYHEGPGETWYDGVQVFAGVPPTRPAQPTMPETGAYATTYSPEDASLVLVNPPRLRWPAKRGATYSVEWSTSRDFPPETTKHTDGLTVNAFVIPEVLAPGTWYWRVSEKQASMPGVPPTTGPKAEEGEEGATPEEAAPPGPSSGEEGAAPPTVATGGAKPEATKPKPPPAQPAKSPPKPARRPSPKRGPRIEEPSPESEPAGEEAPAPPGETSAAEEPSAASTPVAPQAPRRPERPPMPGPGGPGVGPGPMLPGARPPGPGVPPPGGRPGAPPPEPAPGELPPMSGLQPTVSLAHSFRIDATAAPVPVPAAEAIIAALPPHPRVWLTTDSLLTLQSRCKGPLKPQWDALVARLDGLKGKELATDPKPLRKTKKPSAADIESAAALFRAADQEAGLVRDFALAGLVSGDASYTDEAKRRALNLAGWKPDGATGYASHDQAHREITLALALALDWIGPSLSEEEKTKLTGALSARGQALMKALSEGPRPLNQFPYSSHGQTAIGFLTIVGLACAKDVPEAEGWLRFALPTAVAFFAPWAGDDGGWMQGDYYWKRSAYYTFQFFDALRTAAGVDLYGLPWSQNTARCVTYMHPPYSPRGGFGDGPEVPPDARDRQAMRRLASARSDALAAWYATQVPGPEPPPTAFDLLWTDPTIKAQAPADLPPSAAFTDSGLFAMHSSLADPRGIHLYGRSSRFGSFNHAHADQNSFRLEAFGEPLLIDAGYYDSYRSPHETAFAGTSLAHNTVLVSGKGQRLDDITARGKVVRFVSSEAFDFAETEAATAYPEPAPKGLRRSFIFARPDCFVIWDHAELLQKGSLTWQLHSLDEPALDEAASTAIVRHGDARVAVGAFANPLAWKTTSRFPKNPQLADTEDQAPPQWHTSMAMKGKADKVDEVLVLAPFEGDTAPALKPAEVKGGVGAQVTAPWGSLLALARTGDTPVESGGLVTDALCLVARMAESGPQAVFADRLKSLKRGDAALLGSTVECLVSGTLGEKPVLAIEMTDAGTVTIAVASAPARLVVDGTDQAPAWANGALTLQLTAGRHTVRAE